MDCPVLMSLPVNEPLVPGHIQGALCAGAPLFSPHSLPRRSRTSVPLSSLSLSIPNGRLNLRPLLSG